MTNIPEKTHIDKENIYASITTNTSMNRMPDISSPSGISYPPEHPRINRLSICPRLRTLSPIDLHYFHLAVDMDLGGSAAVPGGEQHTAATALVLDVLEGVHKIGDASQAEEAAEPKSPGAIVRVSDQ